MAPLIQQPINADAHMTPTGIQPIIIVHVSKGSSLMKSIKDANSRLIQQQYLLVS